MADKKKDATAESVAQRDFSVEGNDLDGYLGVSPEYATYANEGEKPYASEDDEAEQKVRDAKPEAVTTTGVPVSQMEDDDDSNKGEGPNTSGRQSGSPQPPPRRPTGGDSNK